MFEESRDLRGEDFGASILPVQYSTSVRGRKLVEGEYRLLLAVLEDALRCYLNNLNPRSPQQRLRFAEARDWFYSRWDVRQRAPIPFEYICDQLGIEANVFRSRLNSISIRDLPTHRRPVRHSLVTERRRARDQRTARFARRLQSDDADRATNRTICRAGARRSCCTASAKVFHLIARGKLIPMAPIEPE
jgi:hypothetical protein